MTPGRLYTIGNFTIDDLVFWPGGAAISTVVLRNEIQPASQRS